MNKTEKILKTLTPKVQKQAPVATDMFLPNLSGDHSAGIVRATPTDNLDIANKKYVDDSNHVRLHDLSSSTDHVGTALTAGYLIKSTGLLKLPANATNTDADVAAAVAASHAQVHTHLLAAGATDVTATAAELNLVDGSSAGVVVNNKAAIYSAAGQLDMTTLAINGTAFTGTAATLNTITNGSMADDRHRHSEFSALDGDPHPCFSADNAGNLTSTNNIIEGTRGQFFAYRTALFTCTNANTWYDYPWNILAPVKQGFTHNAAGANPEQITVTNGGTYLISWTYWVWTGSSVFYFSKSRILDDGAEIAGSSVMSVNSYDTGHSGSIIAKIGAGSVIEMQVASGIASLSIQDYDDANLPDSATRVSGTIAITKLSND